MSFHAAGDVPSAERLFGQRPAATLALLRAAWPLAVGRELALRTEVLAVEGRALRVRVPDAQWRKVLHRMQREILSRLRAIAGDLAPARLGFSEGAVSDASGAENARPPQAVEPRPAPPGVAAEAAAISDPEIRELFLRTAALYLERRNHA
jgi:Dna[CI] antecedent DciA-like protein